MNRNLLIAIGVLIVVVAGGGYFVANQQNKTAEDSQTQKDDSKMMKEEGSSGYSMMKKDSSYIEYSETNFNQVADKRRVLYFYANWCPICRPLDKQISERASEIPEDVVILRVNYNDSDTDDVEKDLAKKYGITYQHTFVQVDAKGNEINKWSGGDFDEILANIK